ncbi:MAG: hypothetical protein WAN05_01015 [Roseiarcus sp.]
MADAGLVEPDKLRLTIEARREKVNELVGAGMSQRKGGSARNSAQRIAERSGRKSSTSDREERREAAIIGNKALAAAQRNKIHALSVAAFVGLYQPRFSSNSDSLGTCSGHPN